MRFFCFGHPNILSTHRNTFEFTKDEELSKAGDCIVGVRCNFDLLELKNFIEKNKKIQIKLKIKDKEETITAEINKNFNDKHEIVVRKTDFLSDRTFAINADKAAKDFSREFVEEMKDPKAKMVVEIEADIK